MLISSVFCFGDPFSPLAPQQPRSMWHSQGAWRLTLLRHKCRWPKSHYQGGALGQGGMRYSLVICRP